MFLFLVQDRDEEDRTVRSHRAGQSTGCGLIAKTVPQRPSSVQIVASIGSSECFGIVGWFSPHLPLLPAKDGNLLTGPLVPAPAMAIRDRVAGIIIPDLSGRRKRAPGCATSSAWEEPAEARSLYSCSTLASEMKENSSNRILRSAAS